VKQKAAPIRQHIYYRLERKVTVVSFSEVKAAGAWSYNSKKLSKAENGLRVHLTIITKLSAINVNFKVDT
jgi:hypothetical protein